MELLCLTHLLPEKEGPNCRVTAETAVDSGVVAVMVEKQHRCYQIIKNRVFLFFFSCPF